MEQPVVKIKDVIENLSQLLTLHGFSKITAESLRKAKFNKADAAQPLLDLIFAIITDSGRIECLASQRLFLLVMILKRLNYPRLSVFVVSDVKKISSRELLIVFGFLLIRLNVVSHLKERACNELSEEILTSYTAQKSDHYSACGEEQRYNEVLGEQLNELIVLRKKIDFAFRSVYSVLDMYERLLKKYGTNGDFMLKELNKNNSKIKFKHISLIELLVQRNSKLQKQLVETIKKQQKLVKLHTKWTQNEQVFWNWMTSVSEEVTSASSNDVHEFTNPKKTFPNRLLLLFVLSNDPILHKIHNQHNLSNSSISILKDFKAFSLRFFLLHTMQKHAIIFSENDAAEDRGDEKKKMNSILNEEVVRLEKQVKLLEENNRLWLSNLLSQRFSDLIQLPVPRR